MSSLATLLPKFQANISVTFAASVVADINTHWLKQRVGSPGTLAAAVGATDATITLTLESGGGLGFVSAEAGSTIVVDGEAMVVTARNNAQLTVTRNVGPIGAFLGGGAAPTHEPGAVVYLLKYTDPFSMAADEALRPWAQQIVLALGSESATFGYTAFGSLTPSIT